VIETNTPAQDAEITAQVLSKLATYRGVLARVQVSTQGPGGEGWW
jgi:hypothetical protein